MKCPNCNAELADDAKFCGRCGFNLTAGSKKCEKCGAILKPGDVFCTVCGSKINNDIVLPKINEPSAQTNKEDLEFMVVKCLFDELNDCIELYKNFGYVYQNNQMVHNSYQSFDGEVTYSYSRLNFTMVSTHREVTEFLVVNFKRDRNMPHYQEIRDLEKAYLKLDFSDPGVSFKGAVAHIVIAAILFLLGFMIGVSLLASGIYHGAIAFLLFIPAVILLILGIYHIRKNRAVQNQNRERYKTNQVKAEEILKKAKSLL